MKNLKKKILLGMLAVSPLFFAGCSKDDKGASDADKAAELKKLEAQIRQGFYNAKFVTVNIESAFQQMYNDAVRELGQPQNIADSARVGKRTVENLAASGGASVHQIPINTNSLSNLYTYCDNYIKIK